MAQKYRIGVHHDSWHQPVEWVPGNGIKETVLFDLVLLACRGDEKRVHHFMHSNCAVIKDWSECVMDGEKN